MARQRDGSGIAAVVNAPDMAGIAAFARPIRRGGKRRATVHVIGAG
jgi:hypothetical protein